MTPRTAPGGVARPERDRHLTRALEAWFKTTRRALPWRPAYELPRDPYRALVSEFMLQQTQVKRVLEYFPRFIRAWPTVHDLASANLDDVLAAWSGLGYYRRARNLHAAARAIVSDHNGRVPSDVQTLRTLPGVGAYTAGAIASIVFGQAQAAVDGNVTRVLLRVEGRAREADARPSAVWTWERAGELARASGDPGLWNEGLMDLGATVCVPDPAQPRCAECPLRSHCRTAQSGGPARARGARTPVAARGSRSKVRRVRAVCVVVARGAGAGREVLLERRSNAGLWHGLFTPPMLMPAPTCPSPGLARRLRVRGLIARGRVVRTTSAAIVEFAVYRARPGARAAEGRRWTPIDALHTLGVSSAHRQIIRTALDDQVADAPPERSPQRPPGSPAARAMRSLTRAAR